MNKVSSTTQLKQDLFSDGNQYEWIEWISNKKQLLLWIILGLFAILIITYRIMSAERLSAENDFIQAQINYTQVQSPEKLADQATWNEEFTKLEAILARRPELQSKYDAALAQTLIIEQKPDLAIPFAERTFARINHDNINFYEDFAKTSLLISSAKHEEAVTQSQALNDKMEQSAVTESSGTLYLYNLIRLAFLNQQLNRPQEEKKAWDALYAYKGDYEAVKNVQLLFQTDHTSLSQYSEDRKKAL